MTPEAQRIAIAEACGWTACCDYGANLVIGLPPNEKDTDKRCGVPSYLSDLNAMCEAEMMLTPGQLDIFDSILFDICGSWQKAIHATAAQRAEAFLQACNLWRAAR